ncbi:MAG: cation:proton antiporter [Thermoplasmata archaeon]|nr:MAG: cation:proton antiporter [Thermoplasmata archaeon]
MNIYFFYIIISILGLSIMLGLYRLIRGPTAPDRAVALDALTNITTALLVLIAVLSARFIYLDVALVYAILAFIGVVAIARYLEGGL